jgi:hypothetical protein
LSPYGKHDQEGPELYFDHLGFHWTCWQLSRKLKTDLAPLLEDYFEDRFIADERALWKLPGYIFMTLDGGGKLQKKIAMHGMKKGIPLNMDVLQACGAVIDVFLGRPRTARIA